MALRSKNSKGNTYNPSKTKRRRKFGFMKRNRTSNGRNVLKRRRAKKRKNLSKSHELGSFVQKNKRSKRRK